MTTTDIICTECNTKPRLKSLNKNNGTCVGCDCDGAKYSKDMVPYEYTVHDLPEAWVEDEVETRTVNLPEDEEWSDEDTQKFIDAFHS